MAGLLDFQSKLPGLLQDDNFRLGLQLLAAAGPSATPMSAGQRIQQGLMAFQQQKDAEEDRKLKREWQQAQIGGQQAKAASLLDAAQARSDFAKLISGPSGADMARLGAESAPDFQGPTSPQALATMAAPKGGITALTPEQVVMLENRGIKGLREARNDALTGVERKPGTYYEGPNGGFYMPKLGEGVGYDPRSNSASLLPGYAQATGQIEGAKNWAGVAPTLAIESGKAGIAAKNDVMQVYNPATQSMQFVPRSQVLGAAQPGYATEPQMRATAQGDMGGNAQDIQREMLAIQRDLKNPTLDAGSKQILAQQLNTLQTQFAKYYEQGPMQAGPSEADKAAAAAAQASAVEQAKADVVPAQQKTNALAKFDQLIGTVDSVLKHPGLTTATGLSGTLDPRNYVPGTQARDFVAKADQLQGQVFMSAYEGLRGGGAITEVEGKKAEDAIAALSRAQSSDQYRKSLGELRDVVAGARARMVGGKPAASESAAAPARQPVKTGLYQGRKVIQYSDGTVSYAD